MNKNLRATVLFQGNYLELYLLEGNFWHTSNFLSNLPRRIMCCNLSIACSRHSVGWKQWKKAILYDSVLFFFPLAIRLLFLPNQGYLEYISGLSSEYLYLHYLFSALVYRCFGHQCTWTVLTCAQTSCITYASDRRAKEDCNYPLTCTSEECPELVHQVLNHTSLVCSR